MDPITLGIIIAGVVGTGISTWAVGHYVTGARVAQAKQAVQSVEANVEGKFGTAYSMLAHPITSIENAEHAAVQKLAETAGGAVTALLDESGLDKKIAQLQSVKVAMAQVRADIKAKL